MNNGHYDNEGVEHVEGPPDENSDGLFSIAEPTVRLNSEFFEMRGEGRHRSFDGRIWSRGGNPGLQVEDLFKDVFK